MQCLREESKPEACTVQTDPVGAEPEAVCAFLFFMFCFLVKVQMSSMNVLLTILLSMYSGDIHEDAVLARGIRTCSSTS
jgi:hypothetical protein